MKFERLCVLGLGYIGLPTASLFAIHGVKVHGVDVNAHVIEALQSGKTHIHEPGLSEVVLKAMNSGNLTVSPIPESSDAFIVAVPTPFYEDKRADMRAVISATEAILPNLRQGNLVVLESTSPPRTTVDLIVPILERSGLKAGQDFYVAYSPERVLPGQILRELVENARVIGGINPASAQAGQDLYATFVQGEIFQTSATTAEMVKLMENTYRDINIAVANEFARLADRFGVDIWEAINLANRHPRVKILKPGLGVGGHCIGVDPWFLVEAAPDLASLILQARKVNDSQPEFIVKLVKRFLGEELLNKRIAVLGLSYKPDVDDLRESPAVEVAHILKNNGAKLKCFEPFKPDAIIPGLDIKPTLDKTLEDAEVVILLVNHTQFREITPHTLESMTPARIIIDAVDGWGAQNWENSRFRIYRLGVDLSVIPN